MPTTAMIIGHGCAHLLPIFATTQAKETESYACEMICATVIGLDPGPSRLNHCLRDEAYHEDSPDRHRGASFRRKPDPKDVSLTTYAPVTKGASSPIVSGGLRRNDEGERAGGLPHYLRIDQHERGRTPGFKTRSPWGLTDTGNPSANLSNGRSPTKTTRSSLRPANPPVAVWAAIQVLNSHVFGPYEVARLEHETMPHQETVRTGRVRAILRREAPAGIQGEVG